MASLLKTDRPLNRPGSTLQKKEAKGGKKAEQKPCKIRKIFHEIPTEG
jgi:hypothetical protein